MNDSTHVIVGASLAGATAASTLREEGARGRIILIGAEAELPYERPPLSKAYLRGETRVEHAPLRPAAFYADNDIETVLGTRVAKVDSDAKALEVEDGSRIPFDTLLIATGVRNRHIEIPGADLKGIYSLRTVQDAALIRAEIAPGRRAVVVGMGFIGSEVAASLRHAGVEVVAIDPAKTPLFRVLGEAVGQRIAALHQGHGVRTIFEETVKVFEGTQRVSAVLTAQGTRIGCDFAVVGIGVDPVVDFLDGSGVRVENGVVVDEFCKTNVDGIYAAGDVANHYHPVFDRRMRVEHWHNAIKQGAVAARNMLGQNTRYDEVHWFWSDQYDVNLQYAGYHTSAEQTIVRGSLDSDSFLVCYVNGGRIDAALAFSRAKDLRRVMPLIKSRRIVELDRLGDETIDIRSLAAA
jgi:3-phenylpropionate/trans-cinnamate dioxygenase ferredoxin reductase subunit